MKSKPEGKSPHPDRAVSEVAKTINDLKPGQHGMVVALHASRHIKRRLMDMGIIEGAKVEMIRRAPLGDPVEISVHNTHVALRKSEADTIILESIGEHVYGGKRFRHRFGRKS